MSTSNLQIVRSESTPQKGLRVLLNTGDWMAPAGQIPAIEQNKTATITENGSVEIMPTSPNTVMAKATVTVSVASISKLYAYSYLTGAGGDETSYVYYEQELEETGIYSAFAVDFDDPTLQSSGYIKKYTSVGFANVAVDEDTITAGTNLEYTLTRELEKDITL